MNKDFNIWGSAALLHPNCVKIFKIIDLDPATYISNHTTLGDLKLDEDQYIRLTSELGVQVYPETAVYALAEEVYSDEDHKPFCKMKVKSKL